MKKILVLIVLAVAYNHSFAQTKPAAAKPKVNAAKPAAVATKVVVPLLKSSADSASYAFGLSIATDMKSRGVGSLNSAILAKAMNDVFAGNTTLLNPEKSHELIMSYLASIEKKKFEGNITSGKEFLIANSKKPGVITLPSGLQYEVIVPGNGVKPKATDEVTVNYKGTLLDGKQFDSSYDRGQPATFMLNQVIPGWTEGLQQMPAGSKYRFFVPYNLAYGERAAGPDITPYSTLIFEVELISVQAQ